MSLRSIVAICTAKLAYGVIKLLHRGEGATWPGEIALRLSPSILEEIIAKKIQIIAVVGTNGKTTTSKMIETVIKKESRRVVRNESGANLDNGIISVFLSDMIFPGILRSKCFIFEIDEATLPNILLTLKPQILVVLNLFRDQLDRYGEIDLIAEKWLGVMKKLSKDAQVLINGDDPQLAFIGSQLNCRVKYFGLNNPDLFIKKTEHASDSIFCPNCGNRLTFGGVYFSHLGKWACGQCGFVHPQMSLTDKDVSSPLEGVYNRYNTIASTLVGLTLGEDAAVIAKKMQTFTPAFGRMESLVVDGKNIRIILSKNPTGLNESLRALVTQKIKGPLLIVLNDNIPDGRDISWIWDADLEIIKNYPNYIGVSGIRALDMGIRMKYADLELDYIDIMEDIEMALNNAIKKIKIDEELWVMATYSAMLDVRKILTGKKIQ